MMYSYGQLGEFHAKVDLPKCPTGNNGKAANNTRSRHSHTHPPHGHTINLELANNYRLPKLAMPIMHNYTIHDGWRKNLTGFGVERTFHWCVWVV